MTVHCRWLRWKGRDRGVSDAQPHHGSTYSCLRTGHPWGPDDRPAAHEACVPARKCFEAPPASAPSSSEHET